MNDPLRLSVVVVSSGRPQALRRCLISLAQQKDAKLEIIVVADAAGMSAVQSLWFSERLCLLEQEKPNISAARNIGIAAAAGEVVGFIDDDAVAEPTWAAALLKAFQRGDLDAATGPVLGRNGISLQWGRMAVDSVARDHRLKPGDALNDGQALKFHGTNMAFRRDVFDRIGGFDPAYTFYLDDTDMALRCAGAGMKTAYLDDAIVHHGFAASPRRTEDRVPLSLYDIGASTAVFLRKHAPHTDHDTIFRQLEADQRARLLRLARKRKLDPPEMRRLMESLVKGIANGKTCSSTQISPGYTTRSFDQVHDGIGPKMAVLSGWTWQARRLRECATKQIADGGAMTLFLLEPTPRKHKVVFTDGGWWEHRGGLYGPTARDEARFQLWSRRARVAHELMRIADFRGISGNV